MATKISACTFIRDTFDGAFCLFESMASLLPYVDEMIVLDLGSNDGTDKALEYITEGNSKVIMHRSEFSIVDASAFADAANDCVELASNDTVLFWQADEIWHEDLLLKMEKQFEGDATDLAFWRYQLRDNFQKMKWFPHPVHRVGPKSDFVFVNDGMNSDRVFGVDICSEYNMGWFTKWGDMDPMSLPLNDMIMDVSLVGGFRDNIPLRRKLHAPMWHENDDIEGKSQQDWYLHALHNDDWTKKESPFNIPHIMRHHVGKVTYNIRRDLLDALRDNTTKEFLR